MDLTGVVNALKDFLPSLLPLLILSAAVGVGYYLAWTDFKPKQINAHDDDRRSRNSAPDLSPRKRALSNNQLGLHDLNAQTALSPYEQQRLMQEDRVRRYSQKSPDEAASVIKGWLCDS